MWFTWIVLIRNIFSLVVLIRHTVPNKNRRVSFRNVITQLLCIGKSEPWDYNSLIDEEHFLFQKYSKIFKFRWEKSSFTKKIYFSIHLYGMFLLGTFFGLLFLLGTSTLIRTNSITRKLPLITLLIYELIKWFLHHSMQQIFLHSEM